MKIAVALMAVALAAFAAEPKTLPNQAGNDDVDLAGTALVDQKDIHQALGMDLEAGFVVVRIKVIPRAGHSILVSLDDFTLISRKDGDRNGALAPSQIAGTSVLVVAPGRGGGTRVGRTNPLGGLSIPGVSSGGGGVGTGGTRSGEADAHVETKDADNNPLLDALAVKGLPERETKQPVEGLLYFSMEGKVKPKDLALVYKSPFGRLEMEFK
jgi:hypothetical protein